MSENLVLYIILSLLYLITILGAIWLFIDNKHNKSNKNNVQNIKTNSSAATTTAKLHKRIEDLEYKLRIQKELYAEAYAENKKLLEFKPLVDKVNKLEDENDKLKEQLEKLYKIQNKYPIQQ